MMPNRLEKLLPVRAVICGLLLLAGNLRADPFDTLRLYWQNQLTGTNISSSTLASRANTANSYWGTLNTNSSRTNLWSDLPLGGTSANLTASFSRLEQMALAWASPGCSLQGNSSLATAIAGGLDWLAANAYTATASEYDNWWDWEIGGPQQFNNAVVLMYPALTATELTNYNNSVDHFSPPTKSWDTGANLTDKCKVVLLRAIIGKNSTKMGLGQTNLSPVFPYVTNSDGFYRDGSFVQHSVIAYTGTYGNVLLSDVAQLVNLLNGSTWQITDPNLTNVYNWVTSSFEPLIYNGAMMDMMRGRAISRSSETEFSDGGGVIASVRSIANFAPAATAAAFTNWANSPQVGPGQYQFASMDRVVALRSGFGVGLSMSSSRIANYESINNENLHGWFTGDGMTYLYLGGTDTQFTGDFWPTVDPYHLPGTTVEVFARVNAAGQSTTTGQTWVGGAQVANTYGAAGMSLAANATTLVAKKSWFMLDNEIVCLGAGITCGGGYEIDTTVEDRLLGPSPTANFTVNGTAYGPVMGWSASLTNASWCALDGVAGYYFPGGATNLQASFVTNTGSWSQINTGYSTNLYTDDYLKLWYNHGLKPTNAAYAYVVVPNATASSMSSYAANPDMVVLTNTPTVQAASKPTLGVVAANFWVDGTNAADLITVNRKASVITWETFSGISMGVSDPTQTNKATITVTLNRAATSTLSADPGVTVVQLSPQIMLSVNVNGSLGQTYQASFAYAPPTVTWDANTGTTGAQDGTGYWDYGYWWTGSSDVGWSDAPPYVAVLGAGGTAGRVTLLNSHTAYGLTFNPVSSGAYALAGIGSLTLTNGITANASATVGVPVIVGANQTWSVTSNQVLTVNGAIGGNGALTVNAAGGTLVLSGPNTFTNNVTVTAGSVWINNSSALGGGGKTVTLNNGTAGQPGLHLNGTNGNILLPAGIGYLTSCTSGSLFNEAGSNELDGPITLTSGGGDTYIYANSGTLTLAGGLAPNTSARNLRLCGAGNGRVTGVIADGSGYPLAGLFKQDAGTWTLANANTFSGATTVNGGTLLVNGSLSTNAVTVAAAGTLGGTGTITGPVTLTGTISPGGNSVGTLTTGTETWNSGGTYQFNLSNATNSSGLSLLNINGLLNVAAGTGSPVTIKLNTLNTNATAGPATGFASGNSYTWPLAVASGGLTNFSPAKFTVNTNGFRNAITGTFSVSTNGNSLVLIYAGPTLTMPVLNSSASLTAGVFNLSFSGPNGQSYRVLETTNITLPLTNWLALTNGVFGTGAVNFADPTATNLQRFYRVTSP